MGRSARGCAWPAQRPSRGPDAIRDEIGRLGWELRDSAEWTRLGSEKLRVANQINLLEAPVQEAERGGRPGAPGPWRALRRRTRFELEADCGSPDPPGRAPRSMPYPHGPTPVPACCAPTTRCLVRAFDQVQEPAQSRGRLAARAESRGRPVVGAGAPLVLRRQSAVTCKASPAGRRRASAGRPTCANPRPDCLGETPRRSGFLDLGRRRPRPGPRPGRPRPKSRTVDRSSMARSKKTKEKNVHSNRGVSKACRTAPRLAAPAR